MLAYNSLNGLLALGSECVGLCATGVRMQRWWKQPFEFKGEDKESQEKDPPHISIYVVITFGLESHARIIFCHSVRRSQSQSRLKRSLVKAKLATSFAGETTVLRLQEKSNVLQHMCDAAETALIVFSNLAHS